RSYDSPRRERAREQHGHQGPGLHRRPAQGARATPRPSDPGASVQGGTNTPLAQADRLRRRAGVSAGGPITAYDQLTATQIKSRLGDLSPAELRRLRDRE